MKKIITSLLMLILGVFMAAPVVHAADKFNTDPADLPTVMVTNITQDGGCTSAPGANCWKTSVTANPGDIIGVQVYFHNSTVYLAEDTQVGMAPRTSSADTSHTFTGAVASTSIDRSSGSASVRISSSQSISFIPGTVRAYIRGDSVGYTVSNESALFGSGVSIGDVSPGWDNQGTITAQFRVSNNDNNNDDNNNGDSCSIDEFSASPSTIDQGRNSTLSWDTTGDVDYVTISGFSGQRSRSGSVSVSPYNTTTYTLRVYCGNGSTRTENETVSVRSVDNSTAPQALTTIANVLNGTQARLNGIAIPRTTTRTTTSWFEWGVGGNYPNRTSAQTVPLGVNSFPYSDLLSGLTPGVTYTYRAVAQNQYGTAYGAPVSFRTTTPSITPQPTVRSTTTVRNVVVAQSAASLLELRVESNYDRMCVNGLIDYTVTYKNISNQTLQNAVLQFTNPTEITYLNASRGEYNVVDRTMTIALGTVAAGEQGIVTVHARVNDTAIRGNLAVATASVVYTNSKTNAQEDATAYSLITVSNDCPALGASVFGFGSFLPNTLLGWLLLILVILALIVLARQFQKKQSA